MTWKRLPLIRHVRYFWHRHWVNHHYAAWREMGYLPVNAAYDYAVLDEIWRGER